MGGGGESVVVEGLGTVHELDHVFAGWTLVDSGAEGEFDGLVEFDDGSDGDLFS